MAYDTLTAQLVLFGGYNGGNVGDTWAFTGTTWRQLLPATSPTARYGPAMAYDAATSQMVLYGGFNGGYLSDTWLIGAPTVTAVSPVSGPTAGGGTVTITGSDFTAGSTVSFGATPATGVVTVVSSTSITATAPPGFAGTVDVTVATPTTGTSASTGADQYTYSNMTWSTVTPATSPGALYAQAEAYDPATGQTIMFGGSNGSSNVANTWSWNGTNWTELATTGPPAREQAAMAYDPALSELVLFGGFNGAAYYNDTWAWSGSAWSQIADSTDAGCTSACTSSPPARWGPAMAYDTASGQLVLFGGYNGSSYYNDTWALNAAGTSWSQIADSSDAGCTTTCTASPPARNWPSMAFDPALGTSGQLVLFGGSNGGYLADTWAWNGSAWSQLSLPASPPGRANAAMAYDTLTAQLVLFGGYNGGNVGDTWAFTGTTWRQLLPATSPTARYGPAMAYDTATDQVVLYGGYNGSYLSDTWVIGPRSCPSARSRADGRGRHCHHHRQWLQRRQHRQLRRHRRHQCHRGLVQFHHGPGPGAQRGHRRRHRDHSERRHQHHHRGRPVQLLQHQLVHGHARHQPGSGGAGGHGL